MKYYFHIKSFEAILPDEEGLDFESLYEAVLEAKESARELAFQHPWPEWDGELRLIQIADSSGRVFGTVAVPQGSFQPCWH